MSESYLIFQLTALGMIFMFGLTYYFAPSLAQDNPIAAVVFSSLLSAA